jgi:hypothetical protein
MDDQVSAHLEDTLLSDAVASIEKAHSSVAQSVNSEVVMLNWSIGKRIGEDARRGEATASERANLKQLAGRLTERFGRGYTWQDLDRMVKFADLYPEPEVAETLSRQLTWSSMTLILAIANRQRREFYLLTAAREGWSTDILREQIDGELYERIRDVTE